MLRTYLKFKSPWVQLIVLILLVLGISQIAILISMPIVSKSLHIPLKTLIATLSGESKSPQAKEILVIYQTIQFFFLFLIPSLVFGYFADPHPSRFLGLHHTGNSKIAGQTIALVFLSFFAMALIGYLNEKIPLPKYLVDSEKKLNAAVETLAAAKNIKDLLLSVVLVGLFAAIGEELLFRSILQRIFIQLTKNPWWGIILTAIIFSAFHMQFSGFFVRFGLGIVLGALYWYSGSIWISILFHFLFNSLGVLLFYSKPEMAKDNSTSVLSSIPLFVVGALAIAGIIYLIQQLKKSSTTDYAKVYPEKPPIFDQQF